MWSAENVEASDEDADEGPYIVGKTSKKKEKKRQEREAQRQVQLRTTFFCCVNCLMCFPCFFPSVRSFVRHPFF